MQNAINENGEKSNSWVTNLKKYENIKNALNPIFEIRNKAFHFPGIDISEIPNNTTVKQVKLDPKAELLIDRALKAQQKLLEPN